MDLKRNDVDECGLNQFDLGPELVASSCENGINFQVAYISISLFGSWVSTSFSGSTLLYSLGSPDDFLIS
jgi:hypothetical protein